MTKQLMKAPIQAIQQRPPSPIDTMVANVCAIIERRKAKLSLLLPDGLSEQRFVESVRLAMAAQPALLRCTQESILLAVLRGARTGLPVDGSGGFAYIVPYGQDATYVPGYKGLITLAKATGVVQDMQPVLVRERDFFEPEEGDAPRTPHKPYVPRSPTDSAGSVIAAYTRVLLPSGERVIKGLLYAPDLARLAASSRAKDPKYAPRLGPHGEEMIKKDTVKNACKTLGVPPGDVYRALRVALAADDAADSGEASPELVGDESTLIEGSTERLTRELAGSEPSPEEQERIAQREMEEAIRG